MDGTTALKKAPFPSTQRKVAALVNSKMQELSAAGGINSASDLAILTALNIAHEFLENKLKAGENSQIDEDRIDALIQTLEMELGT